MRFLMGMLALITIVASVSCGQRALWAVRERGDWAARWDKIAEAREQYAEVVERDPADWEYRLKLAKVLLELDEPARAREHLAIVHETRPDNEEVVDLLARAMHESGAEDELISFLQSRAEDRLRTQDYLRLAEYARKVGDVDAAESALLTAARLDGGESIEPQMALADFYEAIGDEQRALRRLRMALHIEPDNQQVRERIRSYGEVPGPSFAIAPTESR